MGKPRVGDEIIIKLNDLGLSLKSIGKITGYHWTTVKLRLAENGLKPSDTRRSFMEDIYEKLTPEQRDWLYLELNPGQPISAYIRMLIVSAFNNRKRT